MGYFKCLKEIIIIQHPSDTLQTTCSQLQTYIILHFFKWCHLFVKLGFSGCCNTKQVLSENKCGTENESGGVQSTLRSGKLYSAQQGVQSQ